MTKLVRWICLFVVRLFYPERSVTGLDNIPQDGPVLAVANHPNGLMDPIVARLALARRIAFLAKATLFENPFGRVAMNAFDALPVYRSRDGKDTAQNESMFTAVEQRFGQGGWVLLFPEGTSHSEPSLQRMKTGAARMALGSEAAAQWQLELHVVPVGLIYENKETFRSRVATRVGAPIRVAEFRDAYDADEWAAVTSLTHEIGSRLASVVIEAHTRELWRGFLAVARWTSADAALSVAACEERARVLARAYERLIVTDPARAEELLEKARRFVEILESVGVEDPFSLEAPVAPPPARLARILVGTVAWAPAALVGLVTTWPTYRAIRPLSALITRGEVDILSTVKALAGLLFFPLTWAAQAALAGWLGGPWAALAAAAALPACAFVAMRYFERLEARREALTAGWLKLARAELVEQVVQRRAELAADIESALATLEERQPRDSRSD